MVYDFDTPVDRRGSGSYKWDSCPDVLPMWVADMDFPAAPFIREALLKRVEHGVFGYTAVPESYYGAVIDWYRRRRGWEIDRSWIQYTSGVVPALSVVVKAFCKPGDKVLILNPAYNCFYSSIRNNGCVVEESRLVRRADSFIIDFEDFEERCADPEVKMFIACNPHNPSGRVWTPDELARMGVICRQHDVLVVSDEIHSEIEMPGHRYTPFASITRACQDCCITLCSPSKSFNTAGLQIANIICDNPEWRAKIDRAINDNEVCDVNPFGPVALEAAYTPEGEEWLRQLNAYIWQNYQLLRRTFAARLPELRVMELEGTYLAWVDCRALTSRGTSTAEAEASLKENEKVWINGGAMYGDPDYMRINLACQRARLEEGLERIVCGLRRLLDSN